MPLRISPGHQPGPRRAVYGGGHVGLGVTDAALGQAVEPRRPHDRAVVAPEVALAEVVRHHEDDVGASGRLRGGDARPGHGEQQHDDTEMGGTHDAYSTILADVLARRVNGEAVVVLGWGRAILLQLAHPLVAAGVGGHSEFAVGARAYLERMRRTISAMLSLTFGTEPEIAATVARINAIHARVQGRLPAAVGRYAAGTPYAAGDPSLLTWVHATLVDSQLLTFALFVGPLTTDEKDQYCAEAAQVGPRLGVPADTLPGTSAELATYFDGMNRQGTLAVGETARQVATALLVPPRGRWLAPAVSLGRLTTIGLLPPPIRAAYGYRWDRKRQRLLRGAAAAVRTVRRVTPRPLREWPAARRARRREAAS